MRLTIAAIGRAAPGPERDLVETYRARAEAAGRGVALAPVSVIEVDDRKAKGRGPQSARLLERIPSGAIAVALDERGRQISSPDLARRISDWRDEGRPEIVFLIGGADGHDESLRQRADLSLSLGRMVWPHMLARVMLAEQIYRAISILTGGPYHRE